MHTCDAHTGIQKTEGSLQVTEPIAKTKIYKNTGILMNIDRQDIDIASSVDKIYKSNLQGTLLYKQFNLINVLQAKR